MSPLIIYPIPVLNLKTVYLHATLHGLSMLHLYVIDMHTYCVCKREKEHSEGLEGEEGKEM